MAEPIEMLLGADGHAGPNNKHCMAYMNLIECSMLGVMQGHWSVDGLDHQLDSMGQHTHGIHTKPTINYWEIIIRLYYTHSTVLISSHSCC